MILRETGDQGKERGRREQGAERELCNDGRQSALVFKPDG